MEPAQYDGGTLRMLAPAALVPSSGRQHHVHPPGMTPVDGTQLARVSSSADGAMRHAPYSSPDGAATSVELTPRQQRPPSDIGFAASPSPRASPIHNPHVMTRSSQPQRGREHFAVPYRRPVLVNIAAKPPADPTGMAYAQAQQHGRYTSGEFVPMLRSQVPANLPGEFVPTLRPQLPPNLQHLHDVLQHHNPQLVQQLQQSYLQRQAQVGEFTAQLQQLHREHDAARSAMGDIPMLNMNSRQLPHLTGHPLQPSSPHQYMQHPQQQHPLQGMSRHSGLAMVANSADWQAAMTPTGHHYYAPPHDVPPPRPEQMYGQQQPQQQQQQQQQ